MSSWHCYRCPMHNLHFERIELWMQCLQLFVHSLKCFHQFSYLQILFADNCIDQRLFSLWVDFRRKLSMQSMLVPTQHRPLHFSLGWSPSLPMSQFSNGVRFLMLDLPSHKSNLHMHNLQHWIRNEKYHDKLGQSTSMPEFIDPDSFELHSLCYRSNERVCLQFLFKLLHFENSLWCSKMPSRHCYWCPVHHLHFEWIELWMQCMRFWK